MGAAAPAASVDLTAFLHVNVEPQRGRDVLLLVCSLVKKSFRDTTNSAAGPTMPTAATLFTASTIN